MDIKVSYDSSVTASNFSGGAAEEAQFKNAINYVIGLFDQLFTNPISFTIDVGWGEAAGNVDSVLRSGGKLRQQLHLW